MLIWNGTLLTMPRMIDDQRESLVAASRARSSGPPADRAYSPTSTAKGVGQQFFGERADKLFAMAQQELPQASHALEFRPVGQGGGRIDRDPVLRVAPFPDGVEILERESQRVHPHVTAGARRILTVLFQPLAHRHRMIALALLSEGRHVRRWRRWRRAENHLEQPLPPKHRRGPVAI